MVVLNPGEMPDEPTDAVGLAVDANAELLASQALHHAMDHALHAVESVYQQVGNRHEVLLTKEGLG